MWHLPTDPEPLRRTLQYNKANTPVKQQPGRRNADEYPDNTRTYRNNSSVTPTNASPAEPAQQRKRGAQSRLRVDPVRTPKLSHAVANYFRTLIASGELQPGDALPPETELLQQLGVSRPTLREALRVLESETLIQLGRGARSGAIVLQPAIETLAQYGSLFLATHGTTLGEIHEVRMVLEPPLAAILATTQREDALRFLRQSVKSQRRALEAGDYAAAAAEVNEFHGRLIRSSHNSAFDLLAGMLHDISIKVYPRIAFAGRTPADHRTVLRRSVKSTESHEKLVELISEGKAAEAEKFWRHYMTETANFMRKSGLADLRVGVTTHEPVHTFRTSSGLARKSASRRES